jgi:uncharacterized coiled-coil DUF342 family protein
MLSKTELIKTTVLSDNKITQKLNDLTEKIDQFIKQSNEWTKKIDGIIQQFIVSFENNLNEISIKVSIFADEMDVCMKNLGDYREEIIGGLADIIQDEQKINNFFGSFSEGLQEITEMVQKNAQIKEIFKSISELTRQIRHNYFQGQSEYINWKISDKHLLSIINKFTVFSHKKIAGDMFGLGIEDGDSGGSLTFFLK